MNRDKAGKIMIVSGALIIAGIMAGSVFYFSGVVMGLVVVGIGAGIGLLMAGIYIVQ